MFYTGMISTIGNIILNNPIKFKSKPSDMTSNISSGALDSFTPSEETVCKAKFNKLFPNNSFNKIYDKINKDFQVDYPATLNLSYEKNSKLGGGYTYHTNSINMNLYDLIDSDKKIIGIKNGRKYPLVSPTEKLPLFINESMAKEFVDMQNQNGSLGFDKLVYEDVTPYEQQKFIIQKIAHECIHAKQHQILRETEGIGDKEIFKAWTHTKPKNLIETNTLDDYADKAFEKSPWAKLPQPEIKYKKGTPMYQKALILLEAIRNYPPVTSPEYTRNPLEREAFDISAEYVKRI